MKVQKIIVLIFGSDKKYLFIRNALTPKFRVDFWDYKNFTVADMVLYIF